MTFRTEVSGLPLQPLPDDWIFACLEDWIRRTPDRPAFAVDHGSTVVRHSYSDVKRALDQIAVSLEASGLTAGDRIGILMENIPQWVFVLLGAMRIGVISVPLSTMLPEKSIRLLLEHSECRLLFVDTPNLERARAACPPSCHVIGFGEIGDAVESWDRFIARGAGRNVTARVPPGDHTTVIMYTSGTTGNPKGVELTLSSFNYEVSGVAEALELSSEERILSVLPFSHVLPLIANGLGPLCIGASVVFLSSISPQRISEAFQKHRITMFVCVPQFFYLLHKRIHTQVKEQPFPAATIFNTMKWLASVVKHQGFRRLLFSRVHKKLGPDLRILASGGSSFDKKVAEDFELLGYTMVQAYGLTETAAAATATPVSANRIGTVGKPIRGASVRIDQPGGDGIGEVLIRGPVLMRGYYQSPEQTQEVIREGWLHTGDLGTLDRDGNLTITGRIKDVIVLASGKNVYPEELETHFLQTPFFKEICVVGLADPANPEGGEQLHAIVVPDLEEFRRRNQTSIFETVRFELENLARQLPSYQRVHSLSIRTEPLPRTATRKLRRFEILEEVSRREHPESGSEAPAATDPAMRDGMGAAVANLIRGLKPQVGALRPEMNLELDLGFDSLARVELFGTAEERFGLALDETQTSRIFTVGEFVAALDAAGKGQALRKTNWREIISAVQPEKVFDRFFLKPKLGMYVLMFSLFRITHLLGLVFFRLKYTGIEKLPPKPPYLICPNHISYLDSFVVLTVLPFRALRYIFVLTYSEYIESPLMRRIGRFLNLVSVDPSVNLVRAMEAGAAGLKHGKVLMIFPEGTRSIDGKVAEFKKGAAILAAELGVPIVPVGLRGPFEVWPRGGKFRLHPIEVVFGDPIDPLTYASRPDPYAAITDDLRAAVIRLTGQRESRP